MKGMNYMPHFEVTQFCKLMYRRPAAGPYAYSVATNPGRTHAHVSRPCRNEKTFNYFRTCETPHMVCAPIQGEDKEALSVSLRKG
jgi:hypothetical protein